eukprot:c1667_g1_i1.p2 GENE.c1667_g1_i1~~c1667_g1_i1.p2  ORF type:complete len:160 (+),score=25.52 c1667_g1_i1:68-481(+)
MANKKQKRGKGRAAASGSSRSGASTTATTTGDGASSSSSGWSSSHSIARPPEHISEEMQEKLWALVLKVEAMEKEVDSNAAKLRHALERLQARADALESDQSEGSKKKAKKKSKGKGSKGKGSRSSRKAGQSKRRNR